MWPHGHSLLVTFVMIFLKYGIEKPLFWYDKRVKAHFGFIDKLVTISYFKKKLSINHMPCNMWNKSFIFVLTLILFIYYYKCNYNSKMKLFRLLVIENFI